MNEFLRLLENFKDAAVVYGQKEANFHSTDTVSRKDLVEAEDEASEAKAKVVEFYKQTSRLVPV